ncbi:hypothetical protein KUCAC02_028406 [Chaenocephalus aceratus]|uniref:Uncharacterized protein n=1 Tax=Chaenocephalus aceratus TaxID=36190 RepID=A0ACB9X3T5_CHAAC|nr:hypothetical protein KUCAC02_028406 [Chaenocephalus aceratus]
MAKSSTFHYLSSQPAFLLSVSVPSPPLHSKEEGSKERQHTRERAAVEIETQEYRQKGSRVSHPATKGRKERDSEGDSKINPIFLRGHTGWNDPVMMPKPCHTPRPGDQGGRVWLSAIYRRSPNRGISDSSSQIFYLKSLLHY